MKTRLISIYKKFFPSSSKNSRNTCSELSVAKRKDRSDSKNSTSILFGSTSGDLNEKIIFAFRMYDLDGDGEITKDEMLTIIRSIYQLLGPQVKMPEHCEHA